MFIFFFFPNFLNIFLAKFKKADLKCYLYDSKKKKKTFIGHCHILLSQTCEVNSIGFILFVSAGLKKKRTSESQLIQKTK